MNSGAMWGWIGGIAGTVLGVVGAVVGAYFSIKNTDSRRERLFMCKAVAVCWLVVIVFLVLLFVLPHPYRWFIWLPYAVFLPFSIKYWNRKQQMIRWEVKRESKSVMHFDEAAVSWDKPHRVARAKELFNLLFNTDLLSDNQHVMDYGCGTGLMSFQLAETVEHVYAVDSSPGMLKVLEEKAAQAGISNLETRCVDLSCDTIKLERPLDGVLSVMAFHHISNLPALLSGFANILRSGGWVCVVDLDEEDGTFHASHPKDTIPHMGFDRDVLSTWFSEAGFNVQEIRSVPPVRKEIEGVEKEFPAFMLIARR